MIDLRKVSNENTCLNSYGYVLEALTDEEIDERLDAIGNMCIPTAYAVDLEEVIL